VLDIHDGRMTHQQVGAFLRGSRGRSQTKGDRSYGQMSHGRSPECRNSHSSKDEHSKIRYWDDIYYDM
jgi:hypothetical protein